MIKYFTVNAPSNRSAPSPEGRTWLPVLDIAGPGAAQLAEAKVARLCGMFDGEQMAAATGSRGALAFVGPPDGASRTRSRSLRHFTRPLTAAEPIRPSWGYAGRCRDGRPLYWFAATSPIVSVMV